VSFLTFLFFFAAFFLVQLFFVAMYYYLWFSANFYNTFQRHNIVHIYKVNDTLYEVSHVSSTQFNGPLFSDAILIAEGDAEFVRNKPMNFFIARGVIRRYRESQEEYPSMLSFFIGLSMLNSLHLRPNSSSPLNELPVVIHNDDPAPCSICLCDITIGNKSAILNCKHSFHHPCIFEWFRINPSCPLCRAEIVETGTNNAQSAAVNF
jgi:Ring finger domain